MSGLPKALPRESLPVEVKKLHVPTLEEVAKGVV